MTRIVLLDRHRRVQSFDKGWPEPTDEPNAMRFFKTATEAEDVARPWRFQEKYRDLEVAEIHLTLAAPRRAHDPYETEATEAGPATRPWT